jgi:hypothetical protein
MIHHYLMAVAVLLFAAPLVAVVTIGLETIRAYRGA